MSEALERARRGALVLGCVFVFSIFAFYWLYDKMLLESIYWTVITITGVSYSQDIEAGVSESRHFLTLTIRNLNTNINIVARGEDPRRRPEDREKTSPGRCQLGRDAGYSWC